MSAIEIMNAVKSGKMTVEEASRLLDLLAQLYCKVSPKGAISVYGLQRMPVTLYAEQWERLLDGAPKDHFVLKFIRENEGQELTGQCATEQGGKKVPYTARISRRTPSPWPRQESGDGPQYASPLAVSSDACARPLSSRIDGNRRFRWGLYPKSILRWLLAPLFAVLPS
jgi:hypothetical protein